MELEDMGKCCALRETLEPNNHAYSRPKGKFSINYLRAISSFLGFTISEPGPGDDVSFADATVRGLSDPDWIIHYPQIDFQAKTRPWNIIKNKTVNIRMDVVDLNCMRNSSTEHLLVVLCIRNDPEKWVEECDNGILLHERMYWYNPKAESSDFSGKTVTVHIPKTNIITKKTLHQMMDIIGKGGEIGREL